jgi:hypothetical protein
MKKSFITSVVIFAVIGRICLAAGETRVYEEKIQNQVTTHKFSIEQTASGYLVALASEAPGRRIDQRFELEPGLAALAWSYENPLEKTKISAYRKENRIFLSGLHKGKAIEKTFKINELDWNQSFNIGLEQFALSGAKAMKFWAIGTTAPGDMKITTFTVKKEGFEKIILAGKEIETVRIRVSLSGLLAIFWSGNYWYKRDDGKFLRYRGKGRGSHLTIMEIIPQ